MRSEPLLEQGNAGASTTVPLMPSLPQVASVPRDCTFRKGRWHSRAGPPLGAGLEREVLQGKEPVCGV